MKVQLTVQKLGKTSKKEQPTTMKEIVKAQSKDAAPQVTKQRQPWLTGRRKASDEAVYAAA